MSEKGKRISAIFYSTISAFNKNSDLFLLNDFSADFVCQSNILRILLFLFRISRVRDKKCYGQTHIHTQHQPSFRFYAADCGFISFAGLQSRELKRCKQHKKETSLKGKNMPRLGSFSPFTSPFFSLSFYIL
jgi:hypothetical protein